MTDYWTDCRIGILRYCLRSIQRNPQLEPTWRNLIRPIEKTIEKSRAIEILERFCALWKEHYYAPGGRFENIAANRFEQICNKTHTFKN